MFLYTPPSPGILAKKGQMSSKIYEFQLPLFTYTQTLKAAPSFGNSTGVLVAGKQPAPVTVGSAAGYLASNSQRLMLRGGSASVLGNSLTSHYAAKVLRRPSLRPPSVPPRPASEGFFSGQSGLCFSQGWQSQTPLAHCPAGG